MNPQKELLWGLWVVQSLQNAAKILRPEALRLAPEFLKPQNLERQGRTRGSHSPALLRGLRRAGTSSRVVGLEPCILTAARSDFLTLNPKGRLLA